LVTGAVFGKVVGHGGLFPFTRTDNTIDSDFLAGRGNRHFGIVNGDIFRLSGNRQQGQEGHQAQQGQGQPSVHEESLVFSG